MQPAKNLTLAAVVVALAITSGQAAVVPRDDTTCGGTVYCCQSVDGPDNAAVKNALGLLGVEAPADAEVGLSCKKRCLTGVAVAHEAHALSL